MQSDTPNNRIAAAIIKHFIALLFVVFSNIARYNNTIYTMVRVLIWTYGIFDTVKAPGNNSPNRNNYG